MTISKSIYNKLNTEQFSYGTALSVILENNGKPISALPNEDFVFPDKSVLRLTNNEIKLMEFLQE